MIFYVTSVTDFNSTFEILLILSIIDLTVSFCFYKVKYPKTRAVKNRGNISLPRW